MKKYIFLCFITFGVLLFSCKKDETKIERGVNSTAPVLTNPASSSALILTLADSAKNLSFEWTAANFGFQAAVNYTIQVDTAGNNFKKATMVVNSTSVSASVMLYNLDKTLLTAGFPQNKLSSIEIRVRGILSGANNSPYADTVYSNVVKMDITTFKIGKTYPKELWVVGDFQSWNNSDAAPTIWPVDSTVGTFEGYVNIPSLKFKIVSDHSWSNAATFGDDGTNTGTADMGILSQVNGGNNIILQDYGFLKINLDLQKMTYTTMATTWAIIGDATAGGWNTDTQLTYSTTNNNWTVTTNLIAGGMKFRANAGWGLNYGDDGANGIPDLNGANISIAAAGNYTVTLDLSKFPYSYSIVKN